MKTLVILASYIISLSAYANFIDDLLNRPSPTDKCVEMVKRNHGQNQTMIVGCQKHSSKEATKCLEIMINNTKEKSDKVPLACSYFDNKYAVKALEEHSFNYETSIYDLALISHVDTAKEQKCIDDLIGIEKLSGYILEKCMEDDIDDINSRRSSLFLGDKSISDRIQEGIFKGKILFDNIKKSLSN